MFEAQVSVPVWIPDAPSSLIPDSSGVLVIGAVELSGVLTLDGNELALEFQVRVPEIELAMPAQHITLPLDAITGMRVTGGWWQPRLLVGVRQPSAVEPLLPGRDGCIRFRIARSQRRTARELSAEVALRVAESLPGVTPRHLRGG